MANENKRGEGQGSGRMGNDPGKDAGGKPFGDHEVSQPGVDDDELDYDIEIEGPTRKDAAADTWRGERPQGGAGKPQK
jgi:hypothetical protein